MGRSYDRELKDVFAIQSDISKTVAEALKVQLMTDDRKKIEKESTKNTEAHILYLKGRYSWNKRTLQGLNRAVRDFEEAIRLDPMFTLAYAGLADTYIILENWGFLAPKEALPKAMEYAKRALEIDDKLAEAHTSLASLLVSLRWDWGAAEQEFKLAISSTQTTQPLTISMPTCFSSRFKGGMRLSPRFARLNDSTPSPL